MSLPPLVEKDGFYFAGDVLYVEASHHNRHRRATIPELHALFHPPSNADTPPKDNVGHWYEAQLLHYGLRPSKNKAVAKTRLLDAVNSGNLTVPVQIQKLESDLKKEWNKKQREVKAALKKSQAASTSAPTATSASNKRKAKTDEDKKPSKAVKKPKVEPKEETSTSTPATGPRTKQTARRGGRSTNFGRGGAASSVTTTTIPPTRPRQTARRGRPFTGRGGGPSPVSYNPNRNALDDDDDESIDLPVRGAGAGGGSGRLGLINGLYDITCDDVDEWDYDSDSFTLVLALQGDRVWGEYDLGMFSGILNFPRPYTASGDRIELRWRGRENSENMMTYGDNNVGWIRFLGDGKIEGMLSVYGNAIFDGVRVSGQETSSERSARSMKEEWSEYTEEAYERENRSRWGGSGW